MIVRTKLSEQAEQFQIGQEHYVWRRVLMPDPSDGWWDVITAFHKPERRELVDYVLFRLDYDRALIFVDPAILRPYQRPERTQGDAP